MSGAGAAASSVTEVTSRATTPLGVASVGHGRLVRRGVVLGVR